MIRRRLLGLVGAFALTALAGAWAASTPRAEAGGACGCCGEACACSTCTCAADTSCCKACDCPGCGGGSCCVAEKSAS
jgi:hypothetical protein